jgi:hypothetical protein
MTRSIFVTLFSLGVLVIGGALTPAAAADVRIGVHVGAPPVFVAPPAPVVVAPPAPVFVAPPAPVVIAPGTPIYYYGANYYTFHSGAWFLTPSYGAPWVYVSRARVPHAIVGVPRAYYRIPHHQAAHFAGPHPWAHDHGRGHGHGRHRH